MFDYIFSCKCWLIYVSRQISTGRIQVARITICKLQVARITIRRQRQAWFGNIRDFKDEMHLEILKNYVCIKLP